MLCFMHMGIIIIMLKYEGLNSVMHFITVFYLFFTDSCFIDLSV